MDSYGAPIEGVEYEFKYIVGKNNTSIEESEPVSATVSAGAIIRSTRQYTASLTNHKGYYRMVLLHCSDCKKDDLDPDSLNE